MDKAIEALEALLEPDADDRVDWDDSSIICGKCGNKKWVILGWNNALVAYLISALLGGLIGIILILSKKKTLKSYLPFVPILSFSALAVLLCSDLIHNGFYTFMMYLYS